MKVILLSWFLLGPAIQATLLSLVVRRRLYRRGMYPFFFTYTLYSILVTLFRALLSNRPIEYRTFYWSTELAYGVLALLSLNEVFKRLFRLDYEEYPWLRLVLPSIVVAISGGLFIWWRFVYKTSTGEHFGFLASAFVSFLQGVHTIEGIILVVFMMFWAWFVPGWNRYDYGVLLGFGVSGLVTMTADMVRFTSGHGYQLWYTYAPGIAYILVTLIWLHAFWPAPVPRRTPLLHFNAMIEQMKRDNEMINVIHKWLKRLRQQG